VNRLDLIREIEKNLSAVKAFFSESTLCEFCNTPMGDLEKYNAGLGAVIRVRLLRTNGVLYRKFLEQGFLQKDKMSMEIIREFYRHMLFKLT
jgi:hypothetical protein